MDSIANKIQNGTSTSNLAFHLIRSSPCRGLCHWYVFFTSWNKKFNWPVSLLLLSEPCLGLLFLCQFVSWNKKQILLSGIPCTLLQCLIHMTWIGDYFLLFKQYRWGLLETLGGIFFECYQLRFKFSWLRYFHFRLCWKIKVFRLLLELVRPPPSSPIPKIAATPLKKYFSTSVAIN